MPARTDFDRHSKNEQLSPVYALIGTDSMLVSEAVEALRKRVLTRAADFNRDELVAGEAPMERVLDAARTLPMMAERRWVLLSRLEKVKTADTAALAAYVESPSPTTVLCLTGEKLDQRTKLGQALNAARALFAFEPPKQHELAGWIAQRARRRSLEMDREAAQLLADLVGAELGALEMALEKLALYASGEPKLTVEHVEATVAPTRVNSIFNLTDAIGAKDLGTASRLLRNALSGGESGLMVLGMIARQLRQLLGVKDLERRGASTAQVAQTLGVRPFLVDALIAQARRYTADELAAAMRAAQRADQRLKSSRLEAGVILDELLLTIMPS